MIGPMANVRVIIFDWGRTLHDPETDALFPGASPLVEELSRNYILALVSLARSESAKVRKQKIEESGLAAFFRIILVEENDKDVMYEKVLTDLRVEPQEVLLVDDRMLRGIAWGIRRGAQTIWIQKGKFADELPSDVTGEPTAIARDIGEILGMIAGN